MDLNYRAGGHNTTRLRLIEQQLGEKPVAVQSENIQPFQIWCSDDAPDLKCKVWWTSTGLDSIDSISSFAKKKMAEHTNVDLMILEHSSKDSQAWFVVCGKDNVIRTFQSETDICSYLKEIIARHEL